MHTDLEQWAADAAEQLGVRCLAQGSHLNCGQFLLEPRFEPTTSGYKSNALSIRPPQPLISMGDLYLTHPKCTHTEQWAAIYDAAPRQLLGVRCLAQWSHLSRGIDGGKSALQSLPPIYNSCRPKTRTRNLSIMSPTLTIRPRLPHIPHNILSEFPCSLTNIHHGFTTNKNNNRGSCSHDKTTIFL